MNLQIDPLESRVMYSVDPCAPVGTPILPSGGYYPQVSPSCCRHTGGDYSPNAAVGYTTPAQYAAWQAVIWNT